MDFRLFRPFQSLRLFACLAALLCLRGATVRAQSPDSVGRVMDHVSKFVDSTVIADSADTGTDADTVEEIVEIEAPKYVLRIISMTLASQKPAMSVEVDSANVEHLTSVSSGGRLPPTPVTSAAPSSGIPVQSAMVSSIAVADTLDTLEFTVMNAGTDTSHAARISVTMTRNKLVLPMGKIPVPPIAPGRTIKVQLRVPKLSEALTCYKGMIDMSSPQ